jgi:hypothetical protein
MPEFPCGSFNFLIEISGVGTAGFAGCSGLSSETDVIEYREGNAHEAWPSKWVGPCFDASSSEIAIETLEIVCESMELAS